MDKPTLIAGAILELVALIVVIRLWMRRPLRAVPNLLWSMVLLVPFCGLFLYFFLRDHPAAHGDHVPGSHGGGFPGHSHDGGGHGAH